MSDRSRKFSSDSKGPITAKCVDFVGGWLKLNNWLDLFKRRFRYNVDAGSSIHQDIDRLALNSDVDAWHLGLDSRRHAERVSV